MHSVNLIKAYGANDERMRYTDEIEEIAPLVKKHQDRSKPVRQTQGLQGDS